MFGRAVLTGIVGSVIDFIFPPACPVCGETVSANTNICQNCKEAFTEQSYLYNPHPRSLLNVESISVLLPYDAYCRKLIHALKYHGMPSVGFFLGELMGRKALQACTPPENTLLVPIPLHPLRLRERGYNQSLHIAQGFTSFTGFTIADNILTRARETGTQTALNMEQRALNVKEAFRYAGKQSLSGRSIILIDDVMTTG